MPDLEGSFGTFGGNIAPQKAADTIPLHLGRKHSPALVPLNTLKVKRALKGTSKLYFGCGTSTETGKLICFTLTLQS